MLRHHSCIDGLGHTVGGVRGGQAVEWGDGLLGDRDFFYAGIAAGSSKVKVSGRGEAAALIPLRGKGCPNRGVVRLVGRGTTRASAV